MQASGLFDHPDTRGKYGLVQNIGLGGAVVISLLRRPEFYREGGADGRDRYFSFFFFFFSVAACA
jgi:sterol carrier protein 2